MQNFKRIVITVLVVVLVVCLSAPCFADPVTAISSAELFGALASTYAASRGISVVVSENNVAGSTSSPIPSDVSKILWNSGYSAYNGSLDVVNQQTIDEWVEFATANMQISVGPAGNVTPTYTTYQLGSALVEWFDKYFEHLLSVDMGVSSESGVYHTSGNFFNSTVAYQGSSPWATIPVVSEGKYYPVLSQGLPISYNNGSVAFALGVTSPSDLSVAVYRDSDSYHYLVVSPVVSAFYEAGFTPGYTWTISVNTPISDSGYYYSSRVFHSSSLNPSLPVYDSLADALSGFTSDVSDARIQLRPEDKYNEGLRDKDGNVLPKGDVYVPDTTADTYQPDVLTGTWPVPWTDSFAGTGALPDVLALVQDLVNAGEPVLELDTVAPDPVVIPFLPPTGVNELPSFDFNLSGIWHYVTEWVGSLGSGFSLIRSVWSSLPYAMIVPIYASIVVVIVLGMYRRFFM